MCVSALDFASIRSADSCSIVLPRFLWSPAWAEDECVSSNVTCAIGFHRHTRALRPTHAHTQTRACTREEGHVVLKKRSAAVVGVGRRAHNRSGRAGRRSRSCGAQRSRSRIPAMDFGQRDARLVLSPAHRGCELTIPFSRTAPLLLLAALHCILHPSRSPGHTRTHLTSPRSHLTQRSALTLSPNYDNVIGTRAFLSRTTHGTWTRPLPSFCLLKLSRTASHTHAHAHQNEAECGYWCVSPRHRPPPPSARPSHT